jgi:hypothetical protein
MDKNLKTHREPVNQKLQISFSDLKELSSFLDFNEFEDFVNEPDSPGGNFGMLSQIQYM